MPTPAEILRQQVPDIGKYSNAPKKYGLPLISDSRIRQGFFNHIAKDGIFLNPEQTASVVVKDRYITSPYFARIEKILGLRVDGIMDPQLQKALDMPKVRDAVSKVLGEKVSLLPESQDIPDYAALATEASLMQLNASSSLPNHTGYPQPAAVERS